MLHSLTQKKIIKLLREKPIIFLKKLSFYIINLHTARYIIGAQILVEWMHYYTEVLRQLESMYY